MIFRDAHRIFQRMLAPLPFDRFLDEILGRQFVKVSSQGDTYRTSLLGGDPEQTILAAFRDVAPNMEFHAVDPAGPPPRIEHVVDAEAFKAKIGAFHALGYTLRIPQPRWLSPALDEFLRSLEFFFHKPAMTWAFWSRGDAKAPPHHDDYDLIAIQLMGRKRWFISTDPSGLPNTWQSGPNAPPTLARHEVVEVSPGDLLYLPRGTDHRVETLADSIHLSIAFVPLTLREAIGAVLDHLSDLDRTFRETVGSRLAFAIRRNNFEDLSPRIRDGVARLMQVCGNEQFIAEAMQRRSSRTISELKKSRASGHSPTISVATLVRHSASAIAHLSASGAQIDFSHPGEHVYIHTGAERPVLFIAETPQFRVRDIPGEIGDDVRIALVGKFLSSGFLEVVDE